MITQTLALLVDAYRELNAKKMFWVVLALSGVFALVMAAMGNNERGMTVLWWEIPAPFFSTLVVPRTTFYKLIFIALGFKLWLTWAATILALISTAGIIPDFISGGAIELTLSKPISRVRLFLTKYTTGLLFVAMQVSVFSTLAFLVIGVRSGSWLPEIFAAIPLVLLFFSYLFCITALTGLVFRSTIPALLTTIIIWLLIFLVHFSETGIILQLKVQTDFAVGGRTDKIGQYESEISGLKASIVEKEAGLKQSYPDSKPPDDDAAALDLRTTKTKLERREGSLKKSQDSLADELKRQKTLHTLHRLFFTAKTVLPKTSETMELLNRWLMTSTELNGLIEQSQPPDSAFDSDDPDARVAPTSVQKEMDRIIRGRSVGWVIGTSLLFEMILLSASCWIFARRDF